MTGRQRSLWTVRHVPAAVPGTGPGEAGGANVPADDGVSRGDTVARDTLVSVPGTGGGLGSRAVGTGGGVRWVAR